MIPAGAPTRRAKAAPGKASLNLKSGTGKLATAAKTPAPRKAPSKDLRKELAPMRTMAAAPGKAPVTSLTVKKADATERSGITPGKKVHALDKITRVTIAAATVLGKITATTPEEAVMMRHAKAIGKAGRMTIKTGGIARTAHMMGVGTDATTGMNIRNAGMTEGIKIITAAFMFL